MSTPLESTRAIIVGIDTYETGPSWDLSGPVADACRFAAWLLERGVPPANISLYCSPLASSAAYDFPVGMVRGEATSTNIERALFDELPAATEEHFIFFWGGHGVIRADNSRRLFYADATRLQKRNLDFEDFRTLLRTSFYPAGALRRQMIIVDACDNFLEYLGWETDIPNVTHGKGDPVGDREQSALLAARPGDVAANISSQSTGLFSRELMEILRALPAGTWPPDLDGVAKTVREKFIELREAGLTTQQPVTLRIVGIDGSEWEATAAQRASGRAAQRAIGPGVVHSVNRTKQTAEFKTLFDTGLRTHRGRPQVYFLHGEEAECHDGLVLRWKETVIARSSLLRPAGAGSREATVGHVKIDWPFREPDLFLREYKGQLCAALDISDDLDGLTPVAVHRSDAARWNSAMVMQHNVYSTDWGEIGTQRMIDDCIAFWSAGTPDASSPQIIIFFNIIHEREAGGWLRSKLPFLRSANRDIVRSLEMLVQGLARSMTCGVFPLPSPTVQELKEWFKGTTLVPTYHEKEKWVRHIESEGGSMRVVEDVVYELWHDYETNMVLRP